MNKNGLQRQLEDLEERARETDRRCDETDAGIERILRRVEYVRGWLRATAGFPL